RLMLGGLVCPGATGVVGPFRLLRVARRGRRGSRGSGAATQRDGGRAPTGGLCLGAATQRQSARFAAARSLGGGPLRLRRRLLLLLRCVLRFRRRCRVLGLGRLRGTATEGE